MQDQFILDLTSRCPFFLFRTKFDPLFSMTSVINGNYLLLLLLGAGIADSAPSKNDTMKTPSCTYTSDMGPAFERVFATCKELIQPSNVPEFNATIEVIDKYYESVAKNDFNDKVKLKQ